jgi:alpha-L-rhamnosidase
VKSPIFLFLLIACAPSLASLKPAALKCEYLVNPLGLDTPNPRLSWIVESDQRAQKQSAYQILVADDERLLGANKGDLWDTGKVASDESLHIAFDGTPLRSAQKCYWKVRVWDKDGNASPYSKPVYWEMGLLHNPDWHGEWIARTEETAYQPSPLFRKEFAVNGRLKRARAYICGLGYSELRLNGKKVSDHELDPGYTRYDRRHLYVTHDITDQLRQGRNAIGIMLGTGWFNEHTKAVWYFDRAPWRQSPRLLFELRLEYQNAKSDNISINDTWKTSTGPITFDSIYGGETYDARKEKPGWDAPGYNESGWNPVKVVTSPSGILAAQEHLPIRITQTLKPAKLTNPKPGVFVFDIGQNLTGWAELRVSGPAGTNVRMVYGERLNKDGTVNQADINMHQIKTTPPQPFQTDNYILRGQGNETWHARFCYHGFQYVEVTGFPGTPALDSLRALFVHSDVPPAGEFACSNELLNRIQKCTRWSYLSNLEGIPTDCPHR